MDNKKKSLIGTILIMVAVAIVFVFVWNNLSPTPTEITEVEFRENFARGMYTEVHLDYYKVTCVGTDKIVYTFVTADRASLNQFIIDTIKASNGGITTKYTSADPNQGNMWDSILPILYVVLMGAGLLFVIKFISRQNNQNMDFGKSKAKMVQNSKVRFTDVAGAEEEKEELQEIVDFLKNPQKYHEVGARVPKGVLLVGPPGTGKTLFA